MQESNQVWETDVRLSSVSGELEVNQWLDNVARNKLYLLGRVMGSGMTDLIEDPVEKLEDQLDGDVQDFYSFVARPEAEGYISQKDAQRDVKYLVRKAVGCRDPNDTGEYDECNRDARYRLFVTNERIVDGFSDQIMDELKHLDRVENWGSSFRFW